MSHEPPVPPGNQSPYPRHEPPHPPAPPAVAAVKKMTPAPTASARRKLPLGTIAASAAGVGAIAFGIAALLFPRSGTAKPKPRKGKR